MAVRRYGRGQLPKWWSFDFDEYLLYAIARFGTLRSDLILQGIIYFHIRT
jgi:hypothetical protein